MIIRGGENIYPREIEEFLHTHPAVSEAQVIGVPSEKYGEEVMAWVRLKPRRRRRRATRAGRATARARSRPTRSRATGSSSTPSRMTVTGKVQKFRMREIAVAELGLERAAAVKTA